MLLITVPLRSLLARAGAAVRPGDPVLATAAALSVASVLAGSSLAPGLGVLAQAFAADPGALWLRLLVSIPALGVPVGVALTGTLWRRVGDARAVAMVALWAYASCGAASALGLAPWAMLALRFLQGVALGPVMLTALRLLMQGGGASLPGRLAVQSITMTGATLLILPLAAVASGISWRLPFLLNLLPLVLVPAIAALPATAFAAVAPPPHDAPPRFTRHAPMLPGLLLAGGAMAVFFAVPTQIAGYLAGHGMASPLVAAALISLSVLSAALAGAALRNRTGAPLPVSTAVGGGFLALALGTFQLAFAAALPPMLLGVILIGAGFGLLFPMLNHWAIANSPAGGTARATAAITAAFHVGQFAAPVIGSAAIRPTAPGMVFLPYMMLALGAVVLTHVERRTLALATGQGDTVPHPARGPDARDHATGCQGFGVLPSDRQADGSPSVIAA